MRHWLALAVLVLAIPVSAQTLPRLGQENPRLQSVQWSEGTEYLLTAMPNSGLTVLVEPGEIIQRVVIEDDQALEVRVSPERDSLLLLPNREIQGQRVFVTTDRRTYPLTFRTDTGLTAAYLVRFEFADAAFDRPSSGDISEDEPHWSYRMRGDREVRPEAIRDDAHRTYISYANGQALPAVFAIGPTGDEEIVNGYMRNGVYVIDRVYSELVFRIDKSRATARRNEEPDEVG